MKSVCKSTRRAFLAASLSMPFGVWAEVTTPPALMLAKNFDAERAGDLTQYWISEKLDGVRAYWTGSTLLTRTGHRIAAPQWFTERIPRIALDGELWSGRGTFETTSGVIRREVPDENAWRAMRYMLFDLPDVIAPFDSRLTQLRRLAEKIQVSWLQAIEQKHITDEAELRGMLRTIEQGGGEGLMLHRSSGHYHAGRTDDLLKLKSLHDAEARVVAYEPGKGKYRGLVGALVVEREDGAQFKLGSGLTDRQRRAPPAIGTWVTYAYNGETEQGLPRFPRFLRMRSE